MYVVLVVIVVAVMDVCGVSCDCGGCSGRVWC